MKKKIFQIEILWVTNFLLILSDNYYIFLVSNIFPAQKYFKYRIKIQKYF